MKTYQPKITARLVKVIRRDQISPMVDASLERYNQNSGIDLTPFIGDAGGVRLMKGVHEPAGAFSITLADMPYPEFGESLYALIEPMDMIEFRMAHNPTGLAHYEDEPDQRDIDAELQQAEAERDELQEQWDEAMKPVTLLNAAADMDESPENRAALRQEAEARRAEVSDEYEPRYNELTADIERLRDEKAKAKPRKRRIEGLPIIMRGLVSNVTRNEQMNGDRPMRTITITGQDFGKILQIIQIFYLNNSAVGDNVLSELAFFHKYASESEAKIKHAADFVEDVVETIVTPYLKRMMASAYGGKMSATVIESWKVRASIAGSISPYAIASMNDLSVYQMLCRLLDVGPFNELFVADESDGVALIVRPAPMRSVSGEWLQKDADGNPAMTRFIDIPSEDIVSINSSRSDAGTANYYWVSNTRWTLMQNEDAKRLAMSGAGTNYVLFDYINSAAKFYGIRKMEVETVLGPPDYANTDSQKKEDLPKQTKTLSDWIDERRRVLAMMNRDNVVFESGTMRLRGNERIKAGQYLRVVRGIGKVSFECYVTRVEHEYQTYQGVFTTVYFERGTSFIERAGKTPALYYAEIDAKGVQ